MTGSIECRGHDPMPVGTGWSHAILSQTLGQKMEMRLVENEHNLYTKRKCDSSSGNYGLFALILSTRGENRRMCTSPVRTPKLQLTAEQPLTEECWIPPKEDTPSPRAKEKPQKDDRRGEITFRIKPHTCPRCLEGSNKTLCAPGPRDPIGD